MDLAVLEAAVLPMVLAVREHLVKEMMVVTMVLQVLAEVEALEVLAEMVAVLAVKVEVEHAME